MQIRLLTKDDLPFLKKALYHAIHIPPGADVPSPDIIDHPELARYVNDWMLKPGDLGYLAELNGLPIGAAWLRLWTGDDVGFGFLDRQIPELSMSVVPGHRGQGVGTLLLDRLLEEADGRYEGVSLSVSSSNPARRMYERAGFEPSGATDGNSITMIKLFDR